MPYTAQTATPTRVQAHPVPNKPPISNAELLLLKIDSLSTSGIYFEKVACELLKANGFENVRMTQTTNDYGIDVLAEKGGISFAVQCKCYSSTVGNKAVQEALAGKQMYKCMIAVVFTNSTFSKNATELAKTAQVLLWDRTKLVEMINALSDECLQWLINGD
jgi:restriction system protein